MTNVLYVPTLEKSLIFIRVVVDINNIVIFSSTHYWILDNLDSRNIVAIGCRDPITAFYNFESQHQINSVKIQSIEEFGIGDLVI
jgi:hypothetical protein